MHPSISKYIFPPFLIITLLCLPFLSPALGEEEAYQIGREDVLEISVWQTPDLSKTVAVDAKGNISYPFLGTLSVSGKTPKEVQDLLKVKLSEGYVKDPQVSVSVKEYNSKKILVFGDVAQPGLYKLKGSLPVLEVLFMVSGVKQSAKRMTVIRPVNVSEDAVPLSMASGKRKKGSQSEESAKALEVNLISLLAKGDLSQNISIHPGDTIYVSSATGEKYYVLGKVRKPGPYEWVEDLTVLEAIKLADGAAESAALNRIQIRRNRGGNEELIRLNVVDIMKGKKKDDVIVRPGDVIIVPESWI